MEMYEPDPIFGNPGMDFAFNPGQQEHDDTCAIRSQQLIIKEFTGHDPGEAALIKDAEANNWYTPGQGTDPAHVGELLELYGINCHQATHASVFHLADELAQGHKVIVGVAANDLWHNTPGALDPNHFSPADHAIVVSGIDTHDPENPHVWVTDPGTGQAASYPLDQFIHAWHGSDFFYIATDDPAPDCAPGMENFDKAQGHVNHALGVSYHDLHAIATGEIDSHHASDLADHFHSIRLDWVNEAMHEEGILDEHASPQHGHELSPMEDVAEELSFDPQHSTSAHQGASDQAAHHEVAHDQDHDFADGADPDVSDDPSGF